jgi:hypothetical protein
MAAETTMMDSDDDEIVHWVGKDAFVMPVLPKSLKVDPVVAAFLHLAAFLELSGDETVDPDWAVEAMEHVGHYLQQLSDEQVERLREQTGRVSKYGRKKKWGKEEISFFEEFLENFGIGEDDE